MSVSPRKHRGPLRPVDTLSSPQKPSFHTPSGRKGPAASVHDSDDYSTSFLSDSYLSDTDIGNSSSLFEQTPQRDPASPSPSPFASPERPSYTPLFTGANNMARDREPPAVPAPRQADAPKPAHMSHGVPEFGKASPLKNPLRKPAPKDPYAHLFVPKPNQSQRGQQRAPQNAPKERVPSSQQARGPQSSGNVGEAAPPSFNQSIRPGQAHPFSQSIRPGQSHPFSQSTKPAQPHTFSGSVRPGQPHPFAESVRPGQSHPFNQSVRAGQSNTSKRDPPRPGTSSSTDSDVFEIPPAQFLPRPQYQGVSLPKPNNGGPRTIQATPRPLYSSIGHGAVNPVLTGFQPVNSGYNPLNPHGARQTVILNDDEIDPDAIIRAEGRKFGEPDPYAYVDAAQAQDNLKALLEGAFEGDDEKIPRTRGRKKKKQKAEEDAAKSLADKLAALEVKEKPAEEEEEREEDEEEDDGSVEGMKVKLLPHQVEGVAWMVEKETGAHMKKIPPKGGILADDMGLGKTVQSIALILSNPRPAKDAEPENKKNKILPAVGKGTLIVAPLALIKQWEAEIKDKVTNPMKVLVHHGPNRTKSVEKLKAYDVVITTYQILSSEHAGGSDGPGKGCFGVHWYRVMLDEAHTIKNRSAKMTKACYDIKAHYRWCLTGTPMQNNLDELQSLIKFLQIKPYCEMASWKDQISGPMKNGRGNLAMRRLQIFLKACMKRRTKDVLKKDGALNFGGKTKDGQEKGNGGFQIVGRNVENIIGSFTAQERAFYDRLSNRAESRLKEMMGGEKADYIGALVLLLRLRQACNHPDLTKTNMKSDKDALSTGTRDQNVLQTPRKAKDDADDLADLLGGLSVATKRCDLCQTRLTRENSVAGGIRCNECEDNLNASTKKVSKHKKHRKHKHKRKDRTHKQEKKHDDTDDEEEKQPRAVSKPSRQRRLVVDSDDEDEEGEWLVSEDQRNLPDLGKAGGTDDEDAEGEADTLDSIDSVSFATDDGSPSKKNEMDSFIVHDTDSEDDSPVVRKPLKKKQINLISDDEDTVVSGTDTDGYDSETSSEEESDEESSVGYGVSHLTPSTKIRQLLSILEKETPDHKVIVFSQFTSMLDLIEPFLKREGYNYTRYDGGMRNDLREASLHKLRNDKRTRVLLCSLKCGSLGLNLTAASRVVIMEPFWNPFVEEQAIDRVHRLNQTVDVTVYRLSIHNSVEERILELQEAKRKLAAAALEGGKAMGKLSMKDMLALFKRDAEFDQQHVDDPSDQTIFTRTRVLDNDSSRGDDSYEVAESTAPKAKRKAGSLGLKRVEDSVWGRR